MIGNNSREKMHIKKTLKFLLISLFISQPVKSDISINEFISNEQKNISEREITLLKKNIDDQKQNIKVIDIHNLKDLLIQNNKDLKILESQIDQYYSILKSKNASWYPRLNLNSNKSPQYLIGSDKSSLSEDASSEKLILGIDANFEWDIIKPKRKLEIQIAREKLENSKLLFKSKLKDLYLEVLKTYYRIQAGFEEIKVAEKSLDISKITLQEAKTKLDSGIGNKLEVLEAQTQLDRDQIKLVKKLGELKKNKNSLSKILNIKSKINIKEENAKEINWLWEYNLEKSLEEAIKNRYDLKIKKKIIAINNNESLVVLSEKKPRFSLYNKYSVSNSRGESGVSSPNYKNKTDSYSNSVGINFSWNIFDGGLIKQNYLSLQEKNIELKEDYLLNKSLIKKQLLDTFINLEIAKKNIIFSYEQLNSSKETLEISLKRMEAGLTTQREIVNIQGDLSESEKNFINSITEYNISIAELERITSLNKSGICEIEPQQVKSQNDNFYKFLIDKKLYSECPKST